MTAIEDRLAAIERRLDEIEKPKPVTALSTQQSGPSLGALVKQAEFEANVTIGSPSQLTPGDQEKPSLSVLDQ